jgi:hypothetical protein
MLLGIRLYMYALLRYFNLPISLYGCETLSPTLTEKRKLQITLFENKVIKQLLGPQNDTTQEETQHYYDNEISGTIMEGTMNIVRWVNLLK